MSLQSVRIALCTTRVLRTLFGFCFPDSGQGQTLFAPSVGHGKSASFLVPGVPVGLTALLFPCGRSPLDLPFLFGGLFGFPLRSCHLRTGRSLDSH